jgi:hypothetical protein
MNKRRTKATGFSAPTSRKVPPNIKTCCPKCGREVQSFRRGHCAELDDLKLEDYEALIAFVQAVGGWSRAKWVLEQGHNKWIENQSN